MEKSAAIGLDNLPDNRRWQIRLEYLAGRYDLHFGCRGMCAAQRDQLPASMGGTF